MFGEIMILLTGWAFSDPTGVTRFVRSEESVTARNSINTIHFNILVLTRIAHGANYKALLEIFLVESLKYTYLNS